MSELILHNYYRSSTSYRVRIALEMKALSYLLCVGGIAGAAA